MARAGRDSEDKSHRAQEEIERLGGELLSRDQIIQALREENQSKDAQVTLVVWCHLLNSGSLEDRLCNAKDRWWCCALRDRNEHVSDGRTHKGWLEPSNRVIVFQNLSRSVQ